MNNDSQEPGLNFTEPDLSGVSPEEILDWLIERGVDIFKENDLPDGGEISLACVSQDSTNTAGYDTPETTATSGTHQIAELQKVKDEDLNNLFAVSDTAYGERRFECMWGSCDKSFTRTHNARDHIRSVHFSECGFVCSCDKLFKRRSDAYRHAKSGNGAVYKCAGCPKTFTRNSNKNRHERGCVA